MNTQKQAIVTATATAPSVTIRKTEQIAKLLTFNPDGSASFTKGADLNAYELGAFAADRANAAQSSSLQAVAALRIARSLPKVKVPKATKADETYERDAFEVACEECKKFCVTPSAFQNVKGLIEAVDIAEKNQLEPFKVKNSLGYLRKLSLIDENTLKIKDSAKDDVGVRAILDGSVKGNAVVPKLREAKIAHNAEAKAQGKEVPFKDVEAKAKPTSTTTSTTTVNTELTPEGVVRMITTVVGAWDKLAGKDPANISKMRELAPAELEKLAKLAGFKLVKL